MTKFFILILAVAISLMPEMALAADDGGSTLKSIQDVLTGNIGTMLGLGIAVFGLWQWIMSQNNWGIIMMIGGIAITAFPGIFGSAQQTFASLFDDAGASKSSNSLNSGNSGSTNNGATRV